MIKATRLDSSVTSGDIGVVNAARVSFDKIETEMTSRNAGLIDFLAKADPKHFTPFCHQRFRFMADSGILLEPGWIGYLGDEERRAGFQMKNSEDQPGYYEVEHSLFGWMVSPPPLPADHLIAIRNTIAETCPLSAAALGFWADGPVKDTDLPLETTYQTYLIEVPFYVARQLETSKVGIIRNEVSRRYVDDAPTFHSLSGKWRARPDSGIKQGSGDGLGVGETYICNGWEEAAFAQCRQSYRSLLGGGAAPEQARSVLPMGTVTKFWWTATEQALDRVCHLRTGEGCHAQQEIQDLVEQIREQR